MSRIRNIFFLFIAFEGFYSIELRSVGIKTIRKFACEEFLAPNYVKREAQKTSKVFIYVYVLQSIPPYPFQRTKLLQKIHIRKRARSFLLFFLHFLTPKICIFQKKALPLCRIR